MSVMINSMTLLKLLLNSNLIFLVTTTIVAGKNSEDNQIIHYRSPERVISLHYEINIILPMTVENYTFYGESNIKIIVRHPTQQINLHSVFVDVDKSTTLTHEISKRVYKSSNFTCNYGLYICTFHFNDLITIGAYIFKLKYSGTISDRENSDGFVITSYTNDQRNHKWMYTSGDYQNTIGVQYVFPSLNELIFKTTFNISVYHPKHYFAISNMPIKNRKNVDANMTRANFQTTPAMHPHHIAIMVSDFVKLVNNRENIQILFRDWQIAEQLHFALNVAEKTATYLEDKYFQNMKDDIIPKMDHVAIPNHRDDGLPNWGIVFYNEKAITFHEEQDSIQHMTEIASLVARKVVYQWTNKITLSSWSDIWLNEGIARFLGLQVLDKVFPNHRMMDLFVVQTRHECLHLENVINTPIIIQIKEPYDIRLFSSFRYNKAFAILRMLHHMLTDEVFQKGIYSFLNNQTDNTGNIEALQYSSNIAVTLNTLYQCCCNLLCCLGNMPVKPTSPDDLWVTMQTALNKSNHKNKFNIKKVMDFWTTESQYPVLKVIRNYRNGRTVIWPEMRNTIERKEWWIPVTYATQTHPNFNITWPHIQEWISPQKFFLYLPSIAKNDWIIINLQQLGYYRVMYDRENWQRIAKYLNSNEYNKIHVVNRAQIVDDAYYFLMIKQLDFDMFKELTRYLSKETDYIAWYPMFKIFGYMLNIFSHPKASFIKGHMLNIVNNLLKKIGYVDKPREDIHIKSLREVAAEWACFFGDEICRNIAHKELQNSLALITTHKISLKKWIACGGLMIANSTTWSTMYNLYNTISENFLEYLPCVKKPSIISEYLKTINLNKLMLDNDYNNIFFSAIAYHANNDEMLNSILSKFEAVRPRNLSFLDIIKRIIKYLYTEKQFKMINKYVKNNHGHLILDVEREIEDHLSVTKTVFDCFQTSAESKSLNYSMNFDYSTINELLDLIY